MKHRKQNRAARLICIAWNGALLSGCLLTSAAHAAITFQFNYTDSAGMGFLDPTYGSSRQAALNTAASTFSSMFGSHFSTTGTIVLNAAGYDKPGVLAGARSDMRDPGSPGFNLIEVVRTKLQTGKDLNSDDADGEVSINFNQPWALDINSPPTWYSGQYDFYGTLYHEFTHALGFTRAVSESGDPWGGQKVRQAGIDSIALLSTSMMSN